MKLDILIIDDKEQKIDNLRKVITSISEDINVEESQTIVDAREKMRDYSYDMVILDMVIPELEGEEPSHTGGSDYLTEIYENPDIKRPLQVIGLTEYEEEFNQQKEEFRDRLWYLLFYSQKEQRWKKSLKDKVIQLMGMKRDFIQTLLDRDKYDVGVICTLSEEFELMQRAFDGCQWDDCRLPGLPFLFRVTTVPTASFHDLKVIAACVENTDTCATAVMAASLYAVARVDSLFLVSDDRMAIADGDAPFSSITAKAKNFASEEGLDVNIVEATEFVKRLSPLTSNLLHITSGSCCFLYQLLREKF
jgi:CheY-like chemotaxis protein